MDAYYAHSGTPGDFRDWQLLRDHLQAVASLAEERAAAAVPHDATLVAAARAAGLIHDLGKYRPEFQQYIRGHLSRGNPLTFHKQAGAAKAFVDWQHGPVALAVMGHHGGIPDLATLKADVAQPAGQPTAQTVWPVACDDFPGVEACKPPPPALRDALHADLFTRLLFSCLVDADWTDTGDHERQRKGHPEEPFPPGLDANTRLDKVLKHIDSCAQRCSEADIKRIRAVVLDACLRAADEQPGLFSLTVPTGGGKTLAGLAFALKHAARHGLRRIVYVAPYMTILEQNAGVIREAIGVPAEAPDVFEHYSLAEPPGDDDMDETRREAAARRAENWDAPIIVTTNVQFFESLFSNKPGRCRKLHNGARSVIILDECQTLPPGLVAPSCSMLNQLASQCGSTILLCTATQPAFDHASLPSEARLAPREIIPAEVDLFGQLKRVHVTWPKPADAALTWADIAAQMCRRSAALCVVNTKKAASAIFAEVQNRRSAGVFHLSTAMCPIHRREKLARIRRLLASGKACHVVSTQLIEAGVDVDFPFLMRELAPLESIIQAAGRCNREGRLRENGTVVVFRSAEGTMPPDRWYNAGRDTLVTSFLARGVEPQIDNPAVIRDYYSRLYHTGSLDRDDVQAMRAKFQFRQVAETYWLIKDPTQPFVIAQWAAHQSEINTLLSDLRRPTKAVFRALARFQVNLFPHQLSRLAHLIHQEQPSGVWIWDGRYDEQLGILDDMPDAFIV